MGRALGRWTNGGETSPTEALFPVDEVVFGGFTADPYVGLGSWVLGPPPEKSYLGIHAPISSISDGAIIGEVA